MTSVQARVHTYDGDNLIEQIDGAGGVVARYAQAPGAMDEPLVMARAGTSTFYDADGSGSITSMSSGAGALAQTSIKQSALFSHSVGRPPNTDVLGSESLRSLRSQYRVEIPARAQLCQLFPKATRSKRHVFFG